MPPKANSAKAAGKPQQLKSALPRVAPAIPHALTAKQPQKREKPVLNDDPEPQTPIAKATSPNAIPTAPAPTAQGPQQSSGTLDDKKATDGSITPKSTVADLPNVETPATSVATTAVDAPNHTDHSIPVNISSNIAEAQSRVSLPNGQRKEVETSIRELPPPFYPSSRQSNPSSDSTLPRPMMHHHHSSSGQLAFGGFSDSANSSPAPQLLNGPFPPPSTHSFPGHFPVPPSHTPNGHSYHVSEPFAGPMHPPPFLHHQVNHQRDFYQNQRYLPPRQEMNHAPRFPHGRPYQQPPKQLEPVNGQPQAIHPDLATFRSSTPRGPKSLPSVADESLAVAAHIHSQFGVRDYADYMVIISHTAFMLPRETIPCHGIVLSRSPKLRSLMTMQHAEPSSYPRSLNVSFADKFINHGAAVNKALMYLYGEPLPDKSFMNKLPAPSGQVELEHMRFGLAFAALGHFLQLDPVISRGLDISAGLLSLQNVGMALSFALEGGLSPSWSLDGASGEDMGSTSSFEDSQTKVDSPTSAPIYGYYSDRLLHAIVPFILSSLSPTFTFLPTVAQLPQTPRLPVPAEPQHTRSRSRLSQIRFGEMTVEEKANDPYSGALSTVLVSLPFPLLKVVLEHGMLADRLGCAKVADITRSVIAERESRRQRVVENKPRSAPDSASEEHLWHNARWAERVDEVPQQPSGLRLARVRVGLETPPLCDPAKS